MHQGYSKIYRERPKRGAARRAWDEFTKLRAGWEPTLICYVYANAETDTTAHWMAEYSDGPCDTEVIEPMSGDSLLLQRAATEKILKYVAKGGHKNFVAMDYENYKEIAEAEKAKKQAAADKVKS